MWWRGFPSSKRGAPAKLPAPEEPALAPGRRPDRGPTGSRPTRSGCACGGGCPACGGGAIPAPREQTVQAGAPLDPALRTTAEARLGVPLGDVRLTVTGPLADHARARGADAAAGGNVIAFARRLPEQRTPGGRFAIGHELGHIARDRGGPALAAAAEDHADAAGRALGGPTNATTNATGTPGNGAHPGPARHDGQVVQFGIFDPITDFLADPMGYADRARPGLNLAAVRVLAALPVNALRLVEELHDGTRAADAWTLRLVGLLVNWQGPDALIDHLIQGLKEGAFLAGEFIGTVIDVFGVNAFAHALFVTSGALDPLDPSEEAASRRVHPPGLIPYPEVLVDRDGIVARIAVIQGSGLSVANQLFGTSGVRHRSVTTMHVIHTGTGTMSPGLAVHELTHVGQYTMAGAQYMAQALHAQLAGLGYDYRRLDGSLAASIAGGRSFLDFNREQQAQICEDYFEARFGGSPRFGGRLAELEHFVQNLWRLRGVSWPVWGP